MNQRICPICGHIESEYTYFCTECGAKTVEKGAGEVNAGNVIAKEKKDLVRAQEHEDAQKETGATQKGTGTAEVKKAAAQTLKAQVPDNQPANNNESNQNSNVLDKNSAQKSSEQKNPAQKSPVQKSPAQENPVQKSPTQKNPAPGKKTSAADKKGVYIAIGAVGVAGVIILILASIAIKGNTNKIDSVVSESKIVNTDIEQEHNEDILAAINEVEESISDFSDVYGLGAALDQYQELAAEYGYNEDLESAVNKLFGEYQTVMLGIINNCNAQEPGAVLYTEIVNDLNLLLGYAAYFEEYDIMVDADETENLQLEISQNYKNRLIENFDYYAENEIGNNSVVSRSELWAKMEDVNEIDLYNRNDPEDPLRLRYEAALALHIDSELDSIEDMETRIAKIYEFLDADTEYYCPLLIYRLSEECKDPTAATWYAAYCSLDMDFLNMSDIERKNFVYYYYTQSYYQDIRTEFRSYMMYQ